MHSRDVLRTHLNIYVEALFPGLFSEKCFIADVLLNSKYTFVKKKENPKENQLSKRKRPNLYLFSNEATFCPVSRSS